MRLIKLCQNKILIILAFLLISVNIYPQTAMADSLKTTLQHLPDSLRIDVFLSLSEELRLNDPEQAFEYGRQALELATSLEDPLLTGRAYMSIAGIYILWSEYDRALSYLLPASDELSAAESRADLALCFNNIGTVYMSAGDYDNADLNFQKARDLNKGLKNYALTVNTLANMGTNYVLQDSTEKGLSFYLVSLMIADSAGLIREQVDLLNRIGNTYSKTGSHEDALQHYFKALDVLQEDTDEYNRSLTLSNIAEAFYNTGNLSAALQYATEAFGVAEKTGYGLVLSRSGKQLSDIYHAQNNYVQAYNYFVIYKNISDTLASAERARDLIKIQARHELDQKEAEIEVLRAENTRKQKSNRTQSVIIVAVFCLLAILATLVWSLVRLNRKYMDANNKLAAQGQELENLNDQKDKFFSFVAHNLKNPFNTIMGFSELMQKSLHTHDYEKTKQYSSLIYNLSSQVQKVLSNLLEWSRLQRRTFEYKPEILDLNCLVSDVIEMNKREAARKDLRIEYTVQENVHTFADRTMITTVMQNLISNAVSYTPAGGRISVECRSRGKLAEVSVTDTGVGIAEEDIPRLFHYDLMKTKIGTGENKGAGLGLILCKEMLIRNNGDINVRSKSGKGSEFTFTLPGIERENLQDNNETPELTDVVKDLLSGSSAVPAEVITEINVKLSPKYKEVSTILSFENIEEFAESVEETGSRNGISSLTRYGSRLRELLKNHQIDQIIKILPGFKEYLDTIGAKS